MRKQGNTAPERSGALLFLEIPGNKRRNLIMGEYVATEQEASLLSLPGGGEQYINTDLPTIQEETERGDTPSAGVVPLSDSLSDLSFSVFAIDENTEAFVAGKSGLVWSDFKVGYDGYYYQDSAIIDAEKCLSTTRDDMMCWAATTANMLYYTGWDLLDTSNEDSLFSIFIENFRYGDLYGGNTYFGVSWFLTGSWNSAGQDDWDYPFEDTGNYYSKTFEDTPLNNYLSSVSFTVNGLAEVQEKLEDGYGVGIGFGYYNEAGERTGGHAITLWGLICDTSFSVTDPNYYTGIIITDSDDDKNSYSDPLVAPDVLKVLTITYDSAEGKYILDPEYVGTEKGILEQLTFLAPNPGFTPDSPVVEDGSVKIYSGSAIVSQTSSAISQTLASSGNNLMRISNGGAAYDTLVNSGGAIYVSSGGRLERTILNSKGDLSISSGGTAASTLVNSFGRMSVFAGGTACDVDVTSGGFLFLNSEAQVKDIAVASGGKLYVRDQVTACGDITVGGNLVGTRRQLDMAEYTFTFDLRERHSIDDAIINDLLCVYNANFAITVSPDQASGTYLLAGSSYNSFSSTITVNSGSGSGELSLNETISIGSTEYSLSFIYNGWAYDLALTVNTPGGGIEPERAEYIPGTWSTDWAQAAEYAEKTGKLIFGIAGDPCDCPYATLMYEQLFQAEDFKKFAEENLVLVYNELPDNFTITTSPTAGLLRADGSTVARKTGFGQGDHDEWMNWLTFYVDPASGVYIKNKDVIEFIGPSVSDVAISSTNYIVISAEAENLTVNYAGYLHLSNGGVANNATINSSGYLYLSNGGVANNASINSNGYMAIYSGGVANSTTVSGGYMWISNGGVATEIIENGGYVYVADGAQVTFASNTISGLVLSNGGSMTVHSNTIANSTTVNSGGGIYISSGGVANSTTVNSDGIVYISSGGVANSTTVNSGGRMYISSGGSATEVIWTPCVGVVSAYDGAYVTYASDYSGVYFGSNNVLLSHAQTMTDKTVYGSMYVMNGGVANSTTVNSSGYLYISSGGVANSTTVNSGGGIYISSGGTANSTTVNSVGFMYISSGGTANSTTVNSVGFMYISSGGVANSTTVNSRGNMYISSGGVANSTIINEGHLYVSSGEVNSTTLNSGGSLDINGGIANNATVNAGASMSIGKGGSALEIKENGGFVYVSYGADVTFTSNTIKGLEIKHSMTVHSNTVAVSTTVNDKGRIYISSGGIASATTIDANGFVYIEKGGFAERTVINSEGLMNAGKGGWANYTTVNSGGRFDINGNSFASNTIVKAGGSMSLSSGCIHRGTLYIETGAIVDFSSGTTVDFTLTDRTVNDDYLINDLSQLSDIPTYTITVSDDQKYGTYKLAKGAQFVPGAIITIGNETASYGAITINGQSLLYNGVNYSVECISSNLTLNIHDESFIPEEPAVFIYSNNGTLLFQKKQVSDIELNWNDYNRMEVSSGGTANNTTINNSGGMLVFSGGTADNTTINSSGKIVISSGGIATNTTINNLGRMAVNSDGTAYNAIINSSGYMTVYSNGSASSIRINSGGTLFISSAGAEGITHNGGMLIIANGRTDNTVVNSGGTMIVRQSNSIANNTTVNSSGRMYISSGGVANSTMVNSGGYMFIYSGGVANSTMVNSNGNMRISSGGVHRGSLQIGSNATVSAYSGAIIDFTLSDRKESDYYLINNLSLISGTPTYTITVSADQAHGTYKLAQGAANFTGSITVGTDGRNYGSLAVNQTVILNNLEFTLSRTGSNLILNIAAPDIVPPEIEVTGNPANWTNKDVTLTVSANEDNCVFQYSFDNSTWFNGNSATVSENKTVYFKVTDQAGNITEKSVTVDKIDKTKPILTVSGNPTKWTNKDIVLSATANEGTVEFYDNGKWVVKNSLTVSENGTFRFRAIDKAGNYTIQEVVVDKIDKVAPTLEITGNPTTWTNQDVTLTAVTDDAASGIKTIEYFNGSAWGTGNNLTVSENGSYQFRVTDAAGNVTEQSVVVDKIDKVAPTLEITGNPTTWTNQDVTLTAVTDDAASGIKTIEYFNGSAWGTGATFAVSENGTYQFRVTDLAGNVTEKSVVVDKIDKTAPTLEITGNATTWTNQDVTLTAVTDDAASGVTKVEYFNGSAWGTGETFAVSENGTYLFRVTDLAGNVTEQSIVVDKIDKVAPTLEITGNATAWTNKDVTLTAMTDDAASGVTKVEYFNGSVWQTGSSLTVSENGIYKFRVTDLAGNIVTTSVTVDKISKVAPELEITGNAVFWTNQNVTLTAIAKDSLDGTIEYFDGSAWQTGNTLTVSENGTYKFRVTDVAGNVTEQSVVVDKIDKLAPELSITGNPTSWTNQNVTLTAVTSDDASGVKKVEYFDGSAWITGNTLVISENGTYQFRVTDFSGNVTEQSVVVDRIDKIAPSLEISGNVTEWTNKDVTLSAIVSDGTVEYFNGTEWIEGNSLTAFENGTYQFRVTDRAGNVTEKSVAVDKIDKIAPAAPVVSADITDWTNSKVTVSADFDSDAVKKEYSYNSKTWYTYTSGVAFSAAGTIYFRAIDHVGNVSDITSYRVNNIDTLAPQTPVGLTVVEVDSSLRFDWKDASDAGKAGIAGYYVRYGQGDLTGEGTFVESSRFEAGSLAVGTWHYQVRSLDAAGNFSDWSDEFTFEVSPEAPTGLTGSAEGLKWENVAGASGYVVEYSTDDFATVVTLESTTCAIDSYALPEGAFKWRVRSGNGSTWAYGEEITSVLSESAKILTSDADGDMDLFFGNANGVWEAQYAAQHLGNAVWNGTREKVLLQGKNKIADIFEGSRDANILVLTDGANGDALFVDDIYTALGDQARFAQIDEIRAGAGDDIVDMTSQRYAYTGDGVKIYGGLGNDTIWANKGCNTLWGDAGDDRLVGASGDDILVGGAGNDSMHGGGGSDIFTFGGAWGCDTVEQLADGSVTLWFETGSESNWDAGTLTYSDGVNSVSVSGCVNVTLRFGSDPVLPAGAFAEETTEKVFEEKGMLA